MGRGREKFLGTLLQGVFSAECLEVCLPLIFTKDSKGLLRGTPECFKALPHPPEPRRKVSRDCRHLQCNPFLQGGKVLCRTFNMHSLGKGGGEVHLTLKKPLHRPAWHTFPCRGQHSREVGLLTGAKCLPSNLAELFKHLSQFLTFSKPQVLIYKMGILTGLTSWGGCEDCMRSSTGSAGHCAWYVVKIPRSDPEPLHCKLVGSPQFCRSLNHPRPTPTCVCPRARKPFSIFTRKRTACEDVLF